MSILTEYMNEERNRKMRVHYHRNKDPNILKRKIERLIENEEDRLMYDEVELMDSVLRFRELEGDLDSVFDSHPIYISTVFS
jgi:hypothetical protein